MTRSDSPSQSGVVKALLDAAETLIAERGPNAVSIRDVAQRAGLQHSLIFRHIGKKRDLIDAVCVRAFQRVHRTLGDVSSPDEFLEALIGDPVAGQLFVRMAAERSPVVPNALRAGFETSVSRIAGAQARGEIVRELSPEAVYALWIAFGMGWLLTEYALTSVLQEHRSEGDEMRGWIMDLWSGLFEPRFEREVPSEA
ncbi:MAG: TetR/AcrR family transcriptional regulator [Proteobacteria bacterium]|nr:TetR/AcrR family transcriptional regulator [Pseudomonadota bacterium]